jgi:hypothetical protein
MDTTEKAVDYFKQGNNCAQATAAAFADEMRMDTQTVLKVMAGFAPAWADCEKAAGPSAPWSSSRGPLPALTRQRRRPSTTP